MNILKKIGIFVLAIVFYFLVTLALVGGTTFLTESLLLPKDWLFYEHGALAGKILMFLVIVPALIFMVLLLDRFKVYAVKNDEDVRFLKRIISKLGKLKYAVIALWIIAIYLCATTMTVVTPDKIIRHTPFDPSGREYSYTEVKSVETGFGTKLFSIYEYKEDGNFYYKLDLDGKEIVFSQPTVNHEIERRQHDTYLELEVLDEALMRIGTKKISSPEGYEDCGYDKVYVDRFLRIIGRMPNE